MSIIGKKLGNAKKHNGQILEHNRLRPTTKTRHHKTVEDNFYT